MPSKANMLLYLHRYTLFAIEKQGAITLAAAILNNANQIEFSKLILNRCAQ